MSELITNRLWATESKDCPSPYTRMIPGTPAKPRPRIATATLAPAADAATRRTQATRPAQQLLPQPTVGRFLGFQLAAADWTVLVVMCGASSFVFPLWSLPWAYLPIFAALVTLFGSSEGLYLHAGDPSPVGVVAALARSTLFAIGLVVVAAWNRMHPLAAFAVFGSSLAGLVLCRRVRQMAWKRRCLGTAPRKILIVGGGPIARSIARALRNDPLQRTTVCGFVDDDLPLSPVILGRIADLDWLARAEFIDEVVLALPASALSREKLPKSRSGTTWTFVPCPICLRVHGLTPASITSGKYRSSPCIASRCLASPCF
jgi:hypothetical protein